MDEEAEPGIEGNPVEDEVELILHQQEEGEGRPVHQPWREHGRVGCAEGFVGEEDGQQDGCDRRQYVCNEAKHLEGIWCW